jgi:putative transcriptional regulator
MSEHAFFQDQFLIAMPQQGDQLFSQALVYICEHNEEGAMGLIVNKPLPIELPALTQQMGLETCEKELSENLQNQVFFGGPCQTNHGFILHNGGLSWPSSIQVNEDVVLTSSQDILADIALLKGPNQFLLALGYSGWEADQLENEMANNIWINTLNNAGNKQQIILASTFNCSVLQQVLIKLEHFKKK